MSDRERFDIEFYMVPSEASEAAVRDRTVAAIDVLRACSTIPIAFRAGADKVVPVDTAVAAKTLRASLGEHALLCGERDGRKVPGFDRGNSPLEYTAAVVSGKTLVFASTNGSKVLARTAGALEGLACSFVNVGAVARYLLGQERPVAIILSGQLGRFSLEDAVCGGRLVSLLVEARPALSACDAALASTALASRWDGDLLAMLRTTAHGRYLETIGFGEDLAVCARLDSVPLVPVCREGRIT